MKTTTTTTKRQQQVEKKNKERILQSAEKLQAITSNENNIVNIKAVEIMQRLKQCKDVNDLEFVNSCYSLVTILIQSKLKSLNKNERTYNENNVELKKQITIVTNTNDNGLKYNTYIQELNNLYYSEYNADGDIVVKCKDKKQAQQIEKRIENLNQFESGIDLIQEIILKLFYYINQAIENGLEKTKDTFLLDSYVVTIPHSKVYRNGNEKPVELWQKTTTNHIKELSKEISRYIENLKQVKNNTVCYDAIETEIYNSETNDFETITTYYKVKNISVSDVYDYNGKLFTQTANTQTENLIESILQKANFTRVQAYIFKHHFTNNESLQEIADKLQISVDNVKVQISRIKTKCVKTGLFEKYGLFASDIKTISNTEKSQQIICKDTNGDYICTFESLGKASKTLNISKGCLSECLKGKRKTVKGYIFEYSR